MLRLNIPPKLFFGFFDLFTVFSPLTGKSLFELPGRWMEPGKGK
jgi:hypothetical protein